MAGYQPLKITGNETGLVQSREDFLLPNDAYPSLVNAYVWRERIKRKKGYELFNRLRRFFPGSIIINPVLAGPATLALSTILTTYLAITGEPNATIEVGTVVFTFSAPDSATFTDNGMGGFTVTGNGLALGSSINYQTGNVVLNFIAPIAGGGTLTVSLGYFPGLPVMGIRTKDVTAINDEETVFFDTKYAYKAIGDDFFNYIPGTTWNGSNSDFFWTTNYFVDTANQKIFWATNFNNITPDPIRYTNGTAWVDFAPIINAAGDTLDNCLCMLPFRGRFVVFNTIEKGKQYANRIRWSAIGTPFSVSTPAIPVDFVSTTWRDDITGKGGFLDIPINEDIITVGFVRDNLIVYCERSTWQLRYTGRSIAPFQIEKVNSELGVESTFSGIQFDTSLVGIGDKGIVECDSFKSSRIDIKIPDLVQQQINNQEDGPKRVHGIRDFFNKLAYWTYPAAESHGVYPDRRLCYNYENDSWAVFTDSLTCFGTFQYTEARKWNNTPSEPWRRCNFSWLNRPASFPSIMGGNQQGFILYLDNLTTNQESLYISGITGNTTTATVVQSPAHNMQNEYVIKITSIPSGTPFATSLNDQVFGIEVIDADSFYLYKYSDTTGQFDDDQLDATGVYAGGGMIQVRDNFQVLSKKFNYMDEGKQFQLGYIDVLMDDTPIDPETGLGGAITLNVYADYNLDLYFNPQPSLATNQLPQNATDDTFFNQVVETSNTTGVVGGSKNWKRVFCATNANFITIEWKFSNEQMAGVPQEMDVQIDAQVIWSRVGGRLGLVS